MEVRFKQTTLRLVEFVVWGMICAAALVGARAGIWHNISMIPILMSGEVPYDFLADWVGARAVLSGGDPYPNLDAAFADLGGEANHVSTHPPSMLILALPFAYLSWPTASAVWMSCMLACMVASMWAFGLSVRASLCVAPLAFLWPPVPWSLAQLTPIWLLGTAIAWRYRYHPFAAGAAIGLASLTKFLPASGLLPFARRRQWGAIAGFCAVWSLAVLLILILRPDILSVYVAANKSLDQVQRHDNGAFLMIAWRIGRWIGVGFAGMFIIGMAYSALCRRLSEWDRWACCVWLGVALLPIAWVYSLLPLLPWLMRGMVQRDLAGRILSAVALLTPLAGPVLAQNPASVAVSIAFAGLAFLTADEVTMDPAR